MGACTSTSSVRVAPTAAAVIISDAAGTAGHQVPVAISSDTAGTAGHQVPMYTQIGHTIPRSERGDRKAKLKAPVEQNPRERDLVLDAKILRGELEDVARKYVLHEEKRIVSCLLSSTFTDTESERNLLIADVVPYLHEYARQRVFDHTRVLSVSAMHQTVGLLLVLGASASAYVTPGAMPLSGARSVRNASA
jgi:hypothetical protein